MNNSRFRLLIACTLIAPHLPVSIGIAGYLMFILLAAFSMYE